MHSLAISSPTIEWIVSWIAHHFRQFFYWCGQYHYSIPIGWESGGRRVAMKWQGNGYINTENSQMASISTIFTSTYHTKQLNLWPNSSASHVVNYNWLSAYQGCLLIKGRWSHLKTTWPLMAIWQTSETSHIKSSQANFQHQCPAKLLVNVYSHIGGLMMKSMSYCWVHGRWIVSNPVTFGDSNLYCKSSVAWLTIQAIPWEPVIFAVNPHSMVDSQSNLVSSMHGNDVCSYVQRNSLLSIVLWEA